MQKKTTAHTAKLHLTMTSRVAVGITRGFDGEIHLSSYISGASSIPIFSGPLRLIVSEEVTSSAAFGDQGECLAFEDRGVWRGR